MGRIGNPLQHAGTVEHLHLNFSEQNPGTEYRPPFAKWLAEHEADYSRMLGFRDELAKKGGEEWLFSIHGIHATQPTT